MNHVRVIFLLLTCVYSFSSTAHVRSEIFRGTSSTYHGPHNLETNHFIENLLVSQAVFTLVNAAMFRKELLNKEVGLLPIAALSSVEVAKNLINFVNIEIQSNFVGPVLSYAMLNYFRAHLPNHPGANSPWFYIEVALAEWVKNKINFEVTENWYPRSWLPALPLT
jgi:hypothetical protein